MVVDKVIVENDVSLLKTILLGMGAAMIFVQVASLAQEYLLSFAAVRLDTAILDFLSRQILSLPMSYFTSRRTGDIQRRLDGARQVRQFAVHHGVGALLALVQLVGALVLMAIYSPSLTVAFLATTPLYGGLMYFSLKVLRPLFAEVEESQGKYSSHQIDAIKGIEAVKAASAENRLSRHDVERISLRLAKDFPEQFHRHVLRQRAANHRHALDRDLSLGRREPGHVRVISASAALSPSAR